MNTFIRLELSIFAVGLSFALCYDAPGELAFSSKTNDICIGICGVEAISLSIGDALSKTAPIPYDERLAVVAFCRTGHARLLIPHKSIFMSFELRDSAGNLVPMTAGGAEWGTRVAFPDKPGRNPRSRMTPWEVGKIDEGLPTGPMLPAARDLFRITKAGVYRLKVVVRLALQTGPEKRFSWSPIEFSPVVVSVLKPEESKVNGVRDN